jgi:hypothetical protein
LKNGRFKPLLLRKIFVEDRMNRALRQSHRKRCAFRKSGGGYGQGAPLVPFNPAVDTDFSIKMPINQAYSDCDIPGRPGQLVNTPQPGLAQTVMAGGGCGCSGPKVGGSRRRKQRGGACGCSVPKWGGRRRSRRQHGGSYGFGVDVSRSVGGDGPIAAPVYAPVPCDARAGSMNPLAQTTGMAADPRAPTDLYSLTPNQTGGSYGQGNGWSDSCYKAPGSSLPTYEATTAGFQFRPSTETGSTLPDGVTAYNNVVPYAARMGGSRRKSRKSRKSKKSKKARKH